MNNNKKKIEDKNIKDEEEKMKGFQTYKKHLRISSVIDQNVS
jgi:hypothetical protein